MEIAIDCRRRPWLRMRSSRSFVPFTAIGEQLRPISSSTSFRRSISARNHSAHWGKTGSPNLTASRWSTKPAASSYRTVRLASEFDPNLVSKSALERRTTCRTGRFRPGIWSDER